MRRPAPSSSYKVLCGIGAVLLIVGLLGLYVFMPRRIASDRQAVAFDGVIENKVLVRIGQSRYGASVSHILVIRQKTGEVVRFPVPREVYGQARVGMLARKRAGEQWPTLGASASP